MRELPEFEYACPGVVGEEGEGDGDEEPKSRLVVENNREGRRRLEVN